MPFRSDDHPFTSEGILAVPAREQGVYGICVKGAGNDPNAGWLAWPDCWIYVGQGEIRTKLAEHLAGQGDQANCVWQNIAGAQLGVRFAFEVTSDGARRRDELIAELRPACNVP